MTVEKKALSPAQLAHHQKLRDIQAERKLAAQSNNTDVLELEEPEQVQGQVRQQAMQSLPYSTTPISIPKVARVLPPPTSKYDPKKRYHFQLINKDYESVKPRDKDTNEVMDNPFPPIWFAEPAGQGINPGSGDIEHWRYVAGYPSIWVKDQTKPVPTQAQLENPKNFIEFRNGSLFVSGMNGALLDALMIQDAYEEVKDPINPVPPTFRLVNPEKELKLTRSVSDMKFEASKAAREATVEEMLPVAMYFGINVDNPERDLDRIRTEFIMRAESDPEAFNRQFTNPRIEFKYKITLALRANIINTSSIPGKMVLTDTNRAFFDVKEGDAAEQFAQLVYNRNDDAVKLYNQIENLL
jgi:hypothetical protein